MQVFSIHLLAHLALRYPLPRSLSLAHTVTGRLFSLAQSGNQSAFLGIFATCLSALVKLVDAFPADSALRDEVIGLISKARGLIARDGRDVVLTVNSNSFSINIGGLNTNTDLTPERLSADMDAALVNLKS